MNQAKIDELFARLKAACAKEPTQAQIDVLKESILDNRLSDEEILRGYRASRDAEDPWWPKPGEFLVRARPPASAPVIFGEAETIFQLILDHPLKYGTYNPESGTVWDRRKIEAAHGRAAGEAFGSVQGRFRTMETLADEKWVRKAFCDAYAEARSDHGAPLALTPPSNRLKAPEPTKAITGQAEDGDLIEILKERFREALHGPGIPAHLPLDFEARKSFLMEQAEDLYQPESAAVKADLAQASEVTR